MDHRTFSYSPEKFALVCGSEEINGFAKDSSILVRHTEDRVTYTPGIADGVRVFNPNRHGEIVLNLLMGSPSNTVLFNFLKSNEDNPGTGDFTLSLVDKNSQEGTTIIEVSSPITWIVRYPEYGWSGNHEVRVWTFQGDNLSWRQTGSHMQANVPSSA